MCFVRLNCGFTIKILTLSIGIFMIISKQNFTRVTWVVHYLRPSNWKAKKNFLPASHYSSALYTHTHPRVQAQTLKVAYFRIYAISHNLRALNQISLARTSTSKPIIPARVFHHVPESLQTNARIVLPVRSRCLRPTFFPIHYPVSSSSSIQ